MIDIDIDTGTLQLHQGFVEKMEPGTELKELKSAFPRWEQTVWDSERSSLKVALQKIPNDKTVHLRLYFVKSKLSSVEIFITGATLGDGWGPRSKAKDVRKKKYHGRNTTPGTWIFLPDEMPTAISCITPLMTAIACCVRSTRRSGATVASLPSDFNPWIAVLRSCICEDVK
jgi:hypothetical protein